MRQHELVALKAKQNILRSSRYRIKLFYRYCKSYSKNLNASKIDESAPNQEPNVELEKIIERKVILMHIPGCKEVTRNQQKLHFSHRLSLKPEKRIRCL